MPEPPASPAAKPAPRWAPASAHGSSPTRQGRTPRPIQERQPPPTSPGRASSPGTCREITKPREPPKPSDLLHFLALLLHPLVHFPLELFEELLDLRLQGLDLVLRVVPRCLHLVGV